VQLTIGAVSLGAPELLALAVAGTVAGALQSSLGFGASFVMVPTLALVAPEMLPGAILVAVIPLSVGMILVQRDGLDLPAVGRVTLGRLPGIVAGGALVGALSVDALTVAIAIVLLAAVASAACGWEVPITRRNELTAGVVSGLTGTAAALGGPPMALLYRGAAGAHLRPTLAAIWLVGSAPILVSLATFGSLTLAQVLLGGLLAVVMLVGLTLAHPLVDRLSDGTLRRLVLWWAGAGSVVALARAVLSF
jgi:uncharacterized protein